MNSKLVLRIFTVCILVGLAAACVIYAQRRAKTDLAASGPVSDVQTTGAPSTREAARNVSAPDFRRTSVSLVTDESSSVPDPAVLLPHRGSQSVVLRQDGASATKRVIENRASDLPFKGPVRTNVSPGSPPAVLQSAEASDNPIETFPAATSRASVPAPPDPASPAGVLLPRSERKLAFSTRSAPVFVAPRTAPAPIDPSEAAGFSVPSQPAPPTNATPPAAVEASPNLTAIPQAGTAPKPRFLAPGSKSLDLLLLENTALTLKKEPAPTVQSVTQPPRASTESPEAP